MALEIVPVDTRRTWRDFLSLPRRLFRHDPAWVPALDGEVRRTLDETRNPYFRSARLMRWLCYRDHHPAARCITVVHPSYREASGHFPALFGFFDAVDDLEAVTALFEVAGSDVRSLGATRLIGPFHPHHYSEMGLQVDQFDVPPTFFQPHHLHYYRSLFEHDGWSVERTIHTRRNPAIRSWLDAHPAPHVSTPDLRMRHIDLSDLEHELERIRDVYNDAFAPNAYFLPVSKDEYRYAASGLRLMTRPELNVIVEHRTEPVGVLQCMLDINPLLLAFPSGRITPWGSVRFIAGRRSVRRLVVYAVGIKRAWQRGRVHALLFSALHHMAREFDELETTWMSPGNPISIRAAERFGMVEDKHFVMMRKELEK